MEESNNHNSEDERGFSYSKSNLSAKGILVRVILIATTALICYLLGSYFG